MYYYSQDLPLDLCSIWVWSRGEEPDDCRQATGHSAFISLAIIICSMCPNSASIESTFSVFGITNTKLRNSLDVKTYHNNTLIRAERLQEHQRLGISHTQRKKRQMYVSDGDGGSTMEEATPDDLFSAADHLVSKANEDNVNYFSDSDLDDDNIDTVTPLEPNERNTTLK